MLLLVLRNEVEKEIEDLDKWVLGDLEFSSLIREDEEITEVDEEVGGVADKLIIMVLLSNWDLGKKGFRRELRKRRDGWK